MNIDGETLFLVLGGIALGAILHATISLFIPPAIAYSMLLAIAVVLLATQVDI